MSIKGENFNLLGDHFHPLIAILAPTYWIWDDPRTLLIDQVIIVFVASELVLRLARRHWNPGQALLLAVAFAVAPALQTLVHYDFHEISLSLPLVTLIFDGIDRRRPRMVVLSALALTLVREDMGIVVAMFGVALFLTKRMSRYVAIVLMILGCSVFLLATFVVIPHFNPGGFGYWDYPSLGTTPRAAIHTLLTRPWAAAGALMWPPIKLVTLSLLLGPLALLPLRSWYSLPGWVVLASRFLAGRSMLWTPYFHYDSVVWAVFFGAALDAAARSPRVHQWPRIIAWSSASALVFACILVPRATPLYKIFTPKLWIASSRDADRAAAVKSISPDECVVADDHLIPRLSRFNVVARDFTALPNAQWLVVDSAPSDGGGAPSVDVTGLVKQAAGRGMVRMNTFGSISVYRQPGTLPTTACTPYYRRPR